MRRNDACSRLAAMPHRWSLLAVMALGCRGAQSALDPAGRDAAHISTLFVWMVAVFGLIWVGVMALALFAPRARSDGSERSGRVLIIGGGVVVPVVVLTTLLLFGFDSLARATQKSGDDSLTLEIVGGQWWWDVRYHRPNREPVVVANEIHLPAGRRIDVRVSSRDVIHSFWIPSLAGKIDMIPGRVNDIALEPTRIGVYRGTCAEFCGESHARMSFAVVVEEPAAFERWLESQARDAQEPANPALRRGRDAFFANGCNTCHTVRGTEAHGRTAPDLTHVGSRRTIAGGTLEATPENFRTWISKTELVKPGAHMPAFATMPEDELTSIVAWLSALR